MKKHKIIYQSNMHESYFDLNRILIFFLLVIKLVYRTLSSLLIVIVIVAYRKFVFDEGQ